MPGISLDRVRFARALQILGENLSTIYGQPFKLQSEQDVRAFLNHTHRLRLKGNDRIDDDLLKGLAHSYPPAFKLRTWRRLFQARRFLKTFLGKDCCNQRRWLTRTVVGRIVCTDRPLPGLRRYVRQYLNPTFGTG